MMAMNWRDLVVNVLDFGTYCLLALFALVPISAALKIIEREPDNTFMKWASILLLVGFAYLVRSFPAHGAFWQLLHR